MEALSLKEMNVPLSIVVGSGSLELDSDPDPEFFDEIPQGLGKTSDVAKKLHYLTKNPFLLPFFPFC